MPLPPVVREPPGSPGAASLPGSPRSDSPNLDSSQTLRKPTSHGRLSNLFAPSRPRSSSVASQASLGQEDNASTSGRSTPELRRRAGKAASSHLASDIKYKKFAQQVDKSLQAFESVNEWADFISFLSRLLKTLQTPSPPYPEIPRKLVVSKRLAQCLNPALPSGVHQRALDVYTHIFNVIGPAGLKRDLHVWSPGLFPFFQYATTSVRPHLIRIYETYYLPLGPDLRPATKAIILALLPGLEEETGDFFDKILSLLYRLSASIDSTFFLQNIFLILISTPSARLSALNYLSRAVLQAPHGIEGGLIIRGVSAALHDENVLVRRSSLDLLLRILKLSEPTFCGADTADKETLMRAASGVVLQRELSLSRRVYTWLLGPGDTSTDQVDYFKKYSITLLSGTLLRDMETLASSIDVGEAQRPFKIFLSLLDKWEIGSTLSERLALPALQAIKKATLVASQDVSLEVIATALAVYEAIEPILTWRLLYTSVQSLTVDAVQLVQWLLNSTPQNDEEVITVHIPVMLESVLDAISTINKDPGQRADGLKLAVDLLRMVPAEAFAKVASKSQTDLMTDQRPIAEVLYAVDGDPRLAQQKVSTEVLPRIVLKSFDLCQITIDQNPQDYQSILKAAQLMSILLDSEAPTLGIIDGRQWTDSVIRGLGRISSFLAVETLVSVTLQASRCTLFKYSIDINNDQVMSAILDSLFRYLRPDASLSHHRAVELLWEVNQLAEIHTLENVIARRMSTGLLDRAAFDAFGILWRLTDDSMLPGETFNVPINKVIDALTNQDPDIQRQAETWMRCNLRSYFRVIDPILCCLLDPMIQIQNDHYTHPADMNLIRQYMENIATLFKFGGQDLSKACQATAVQDSVHLAMLSRVETAFPNASTYTDVLMAILLRFVKTQPSPTGRKVVPLVVRIQSSAIDVLQIIVSRGDTSSSHLSDLRSVLVDKLVSAVAKRQLTLQSKTLHLLHVVIDAASTAKSHKHRRSLSLAGKNAAYGDAATPDHLLVRMIIDGVSTPTNLPVLQHWIDFVLMTINHLAPNRSCILALTEAFAQQLRSLVQQMQHVYTITQASAAGHPLKITDVEVAMVLDVLERLLVALNSGPTTRQEDLYKPVDGEKGLLGLVSGVFTVEAPASETSRTEYPRYLDDAIHALLFTWTTTFPTNNEPNHTAKFHAYDPIRSCTRKVLERIFKVQPMGVITSCIHIWATCSSDITDAAIFDCVDALTPSAQKVVELICEAVSEKTGRSSPEFRADPAYLAFLEAYLIRLEAPIAVQVWTTLFTFARDVASLSSSASARSQLFPTLQCLNTLGVTVSKTSALEDRRLRRDLQDTYTKITESMVLNASKIADAGMWTRTPLTGVEDNEPNTLSMDAGLHRIYSFLTHSLLPNLRTLLVDADRVNGVCSSIMTALVVPAFRRNSVESSTLRLILEITKIPSAAKIWRFQTGEAFSDIHFFKAKSVEDIALWKSLISSLMDSDKERFADHLGRITAASSANIFANREQEMLVKSLNLRRLSFILLAAERNHHLVQLPAIQERLVEMLRSNAVSHRVHSEVYLCLRVLLCRVSPQHLANFWPVILAELLRIFDKTMDEPPTDGSEELQLILAACKFLDLLLVLQSEHFQIHQWMFVTDTADAVYPTEEDHDPEAITDCLSAILGDMAVTNARDGALSLVDSEDPSERNGIGACKRPKLANARRLNSLSELRGFFARASIDTFEGVYNGLPVDWDYVESGLNSELFDER